MVSVLSFDPEHSVDVKSCVSCGRDYTLVKGYIFDDDDAHAVFFAALHDHGEKEAWIDVILDSFGEARMDDECVVTRELSAEDRSVAVGRRRGNERGRRFLPPDRPHATTEGHIAADTRPPRAVRHQAFCAGR
jgi:hypothetical protein